MPHTLPNNFQLNDRYSISHQIGQGGFGITYKAFDSKLERKICIKELFIKGHSRRKESWSLSFQSIENIDFKYFKKKFLEEARKLAQYNHPNIVKVLDYFESNNTAYMVMDFIEGKNLKDYVLEKNKLNEHEALDIFTQLLDATKAIHDKNHLHRDIKPDNILITPENEAILIDFGTAKFHDESNDSGNTSTLVLLSHGYSPPEQYSNQNKKDKYTDIYALGATFYFMLTGEKPLQATDRTINELKPISSFNPNLSKQVENAIMKAMELNPIKRFLTVKELENAISQTTKTIKPIDEKNQLVFIDNKKWMTKNLSVQRFRNGDIIPVLNSKNEWIKAFNSQQPACCIYNSDTSLFEKCGFLYNWYAINDKRGLAPEGYRIACTADWESLIREQKRNTLERSFLQHLGGYRNYYGDYSLLNLYIGWWTNEEISELEAYVYTYDFDDSQIKRNEVVKDCGFYIRCVED
jgi:serine/threonine protein kinase